MNGATQKPQSPKPVKVERGLPNGTTSPKSTKVEQGLPNGSASKPQSPKSIKVERGLASRVANLHVSNRDHQPANSPKPRTTESSTLLGRATKWLEATNNAFDRKFRPPPSSASAVSSFHRARNAFASKNTIAERKLIFTRVDSGSDLQQAIPGFRWRVLPSSTTESRGSNSSSGGGSGAT